jgi:hypothetical protein
MDLPSTAILRYVTVLCGALSIAAGTSSALAALLPDASFNQLIDTKLARAAERGNRLETIFVDDAGMIFLGGCSVKAGTTGAAAVPDRAMIWAFRPDGSPETRFAESGVMTIVATPPFGSDALLQGVCVREITAFDDGSLFVSLRGADSSTGVTNPAPLVVFERVSRQGRLLQFGGESQGTGGLAPFGAGVEATGAAFAPDVRMFAFATGGGKSQVFTGTGRAFFSGGQDAQWTHYVPETKRFWFGLGSTIQVVDAVATNQKIVPGNTELVLGRAPIALPTSTGTLPACFAITSQLVQHPVTKQRYVFLGGSGFVGPNGAKGCARILRLDAQGGVDPSFGNGGSLDVNVTIYGFDAQIVWSRMWVSESGDFFVASTANDSQPGQTESRLARITPSGRSELSLVDDDALLVRDLVVVRGGKLIVSVVGRSSIGGGTSLRRYVVEARSRVWEFFNTNLNHYFLTVNPSEVDSIARGSAGPGWTATGNDFIGWTEQPPGALQVCRFYTSGANSHFYTLDQAECADLRAKNPNNTLGADRWTYESASFFAYAPVGDVCQPDTYPIYRLYNNRFAQTDSNHRFTADLAIASQMQALGWKPEGIAMCAAGTRLQNTARCVRATIAGGTEPPPAVEGQPFTHRVLLGTGGQGLTLSVLRAPSWLTVRIEGQSILITGVAPQVAGQAAARRVEDVEFELKDCGTTPLRMALPIDVTKAVPDASACIAPRFTNSVLPSAELNTNYATPAIAIGGGATVVIKSLTAPAWLTATVSADQRAVIFSSTTPVPESGVFDVSLSVSGCNAEVSQAFKFQVLPKTNGYDGGGGNDSGGSDSGPGSGTGDPG